MDLAYNHLFEHVDTTVVSSSAIERLTSHFLEKRVAARHTAYLAHYSRFELPSPPINPEMILPIQPGIFKGTTRSNGIQLFLLSYKDGNQVIGRKIESYQSNRSQQFFRWDGLERLTTASTISDSRRLWEAGYYQSTK